MLNKKLQKALAGGVMAVAMATSMMPVGEVTRIGAATEADFQLVQMSIGESSPQMQGSRISISATCTGGSEEYTYTFRVKLPDGTNETIAKETSSDTVGYTLSEVGIYNFEVQVSDGTSVQSDIQEFVVTPSKVTIESFKADKKSYAKKDTVKFKINATAAWGTVVKSQIVVTAPNGKKVTAKKLSASTLAKYKVAKKGTYKATVTVKDDKTTTTKNITFSVK